MKKILPVESNPPASYNPGIAQPLSILYSGKIKNPDLYLMDRYVQLYFDNYLGDTEKQILSFYIPGENLFSLFKMETVENENINDENILLAIRREIKKGYYIQMMLQEYYIPGTLFYNSIKIIHQHLIYGFDDKRKILYLLCHKQNYQYGIVEVSYDDFLLAFHNRENSPYAYVKIKPPKHLNCCKNEYIYTSLYDYINSSNSFVGKSTKENIYGLKIYEQLIIFLNENCLDMRDYQALLQHKQLMYRRISDYFKLTSLSEQYHKVLELAIIVHCLALKWKMTKEEKIITKIKSLLIQMQELEIEILTEFYSQIKVTEKIQTSRKKKIDKRPYNLNTTVRDTLSDEEFWSIAEEYLPGARSNSQLPLIYGMRLKNLIGKGHYFGVTKEQEQEFLKRVFMLKPKE